MQFSSVMHPPTRQQQQRGPAATCAVAQQHVHTRRPPAVMQALHIREEAELLTPCPCLPPCAILVRSCGGLPCMHYTDAQGCTGGLCPSACARGPVIADHLASSRPPGTSAALRAASARTPPAAFPHRRPPPLHPSPSRYGAALHERSHVGRWRCARPQPGASEPRALPLGAPEALRHPLAARRPRRPPVASARPAGARRRAAGRHP